MTLPLLNLAYFYLRSSCPLVPFLLYLHSTMAGIWRLQQSFYCQMKKIAPRESCCLDLFHQLTQTATDRHFKDSMSLSDETCQCFKTSRSPGACKSSDAVPQSRFLLTHVEPTILVMLTALDKTDCYVARSPKHFLFSS